MPSVNISSFTPSYLPNYYVYFVEFNRCDVYVFLRFVKFLIKERVRWKSTLDLIIEAAIHNKVKLLNKRIQNQFDLLIVPSIGLHTLSFASDSFFDGSWFFVQKIHLVKHGLIKLTLEIWI